MYCYVTSIKDIHLVPTEMNAFIVYSFLATGDSFFTLSIRFCHGTSRVACAVYEVCDAIWQVLQPIYM